MDTNFTLRGGIVMPAIGYGTYKAADGEDESPIRMALETGYRLLDTASFYGNEYLVGKAMKESGIERKDIFLTTKVWKADLGYETTLKSVECSLKRLGTDYVDLCLIHWPKPAPFADYWKELDRGSWRALEKLCRQGLIRAIGVSNFLPHHLDALIKEAEILPAVNQLELHVGYMQEAAAAYCRAHGIVLQAWSPLGRRRVMEDLSVVRMAEKYGVTAAQLLLKFLLSLDIAVIPKSSTRERMEENLNLPDFELAWEDLSFLRCLPQSGWSGEHPDLARVPV